MVGHEMPVIIETERLFLRELCADDQAFILALVNDPDWLKYIGDRGVRNIEDAGRYIEDGPVRSYRNNAYGLWAACLRENAAPIGLCGFLRRDGLAHVDLGYALLPAYRKQGYALEACRAALRYASDTLGLSHVLAIVAPDNRRSVRLLQRLGFSFEHSVKLGADEKMAQLYNKVLA